MKDDNVKTLIHCCLFFTAGRLSRVLNRIAEDVFKPVGFSPTHGFILLIIRDEGEISPQKLAHWLSLKPSTVTRLVDKLVGYGLISRTFEGKNSQLSLTEKGRETVLKVRELWSEMGSLFSKYLGEEENKKITRLADETAEQLEKQV